MSSAGRCIARSTSSGIVVGPGIARNSRPARTTIVLVPYRMFPARDAGEWREIQAGASRYIAITPQLRNLFLQCICHRMPDLIFDLGRRGAGNDAHGARQPLAG